MNVEKAVVVRRRTRLEELIARFNTRAQAKFYIEHSGGDFGDYEAEDEAYQRSLQSVNDTLSRMVKVQVIDRWFMPNFVFGPDEVVVTVGQDGLVANAAKYVGGRPIVAVNPDPSRFDGILLPFAPEEVGGALRRLMRGEAKNRVVTMAEVTLQDGQRLLAFNEFFVGARSHVSARYQITFDERTEPHSSSGILVSTGAGSTGWLSSVFNMAAGLARFTGRVVAAPRPLEWDARKLVFVVREPFVSRSSSASIVAGVIEEFAALTIESRMPQNGVIFSDGVEADFLAFNSGAHATIRVARDVAQLVIG